MDVTVQANGTQAAVSLSGDLDAATAPEFDAALDPVLDAGANDITIDVEELSFLDSSGLRSLVRARERALAAGGALQLTNAGPAVRRVLEITRLEEAFGLD